MFTDVLPVASTGSTVKAPVMSSNRSENTEFKPFKGKQFDFILAQCVSEIESRTFDVEQARGKGAKFARVQTAEMWQHLATDRRSIRATNNDYLIEAL
jgi:hypothetical protein